MSADAAFDGPPSRTDWLLVCLMGWDQVNFSLDAAAALTRSIGSGLMFSWPLTTTLPSVVLISLAELVIVSSTGTSTSLQWLFNVLGSSQAPAPPVDGQVANYFGYIGNTRFGMIQEVLASQSVGKRIAFVGHSLGGATSQILADRAIQAGFSGVGCYVAASPRVGNVAFATAVGSVTYRLENTDDPIVALPPVLWAGPGSSFPIPGPGLPAVYAHGGTAQTMDQYGRITNGSNPIGLGSAAIQLLARSAPTHLCSEYVRRLAAQWNVPDFVTPGAFGYADPSVLGREVGLNLPGFTQVSNAETCYLPCGLT